MFEESSEEEEEGKDKEEKYVEEEEEEEYVCAMLKSKAGKAKNVKGLLMKDLAKILDVVNKERLQVADIIHTIKESEKEKLKENISVMFLVQAGMRDKNNCGGEWLYAKVNEIKKYIVRTDFEMVPAMINGLFGKTASYLMPQDLKRELGGDAEKIFDTTVVGIEKKTEEKEEDQPDTHMLTEEEEKVRKEEVKLKAYLVENTVMKRSSNGFPEIGLPVTSKVVNGIRLYPCPMKACKKGFKSPRTCDAHINRHVGYEYGPCKTCGYTNPSHDAYDKHKCFAGLKTGGTKHASRGAHAKKRKAEAAEGKAE